MTAPADVLVAERSATVEFRFDAPSRILSGGLVTYGRAALVPGVGLERFTASSLEPNWPVGINVLHGKESIWADTGEGTLRLRDGPEEFRIEADVTERSAAWWGLTRGVLKSLSMEFVPIEEHRDLHGVRVITKASLNGIGLVDASPHRNRVELRHLEEVRAAAASRRLTATIPSAVRLRCECSGPECHWATFEPDAIADMADRINDDTAAVIATWKDYSTPLAANTTGRLRAQAVDGELRVEVDLPANDAADQLADAAVTTGIVARPYIDADDADSSIDGDVRVYRTAPIRALVISSTDARENWPAPVIEDIDDGLRHLQAERARWARRMLQWP